MGEAISKLDDFETRHSIVAERALLGALQGGCQVPLGAWARVNARIGARCSDLLTGWTEAYSSEGLLRRNKQGSRASGCGIALDAGGSEILEQVSGSVDRLESFSACRKARCCDTRHAQAVELLRPPICRLDPILLPVIRIFRHESFSHLDETLQKLDEFGFGLIYRVRNACGSAGAIEALDFLEARRFADQLQGPSVIQRRRKRQALGSR